MQSSLKINMVGAIRHRSTVQIPSSCGLLPQRSVVVSLHYSLLFWLAISWRMIARKCHISYEIML